MINIEETVFTAIREIRGTHVPEKLDADVSDADLEDLKTVGDLVTLFEGAK